MAAPRADDAPTIFDAGPGRWWTAGELARAVETVAARLAARPRCLAFLFCAPGAGTIVAYLAALEARRPVALLDARLHPDLKRGLCERYRPELVIDAPAARWDVLTGGAYAAGEAPAGDDGLAWWWRAVPERHALHPDLALLLSTSGTTGSPRLVRLSRASLEANARSIAASLGLGPAERALLSLPLHYAYGLSVVNSHLLAGGSLVATADGPLDPAFWRVAAEQACTSLAGVPFFYEMLLRTGFERLELPALRSMTQAGGRLPDALVTRLRAHLAARGARLFVMYGATEATARMACLPPERLLAKLGSAGRAIPGGELTIHVDGRPEPRPGVVGEVVYRGPNVMLGYAEGPADLALGDVLGGVLRTGDVGRLDEDGFLFVTGRSKRMAKLFGLRIGLDEVEGLLLPRARVAVLDAGDRLLVVCERKDEPAVAEGLRGVAEQLQLPPRAFALRTVETLPRTATGKLDYPALEGVR